jgi:hypothetical protein
MATATVFLAIQIQQAVILTAIETKKRESGAQWTQTANRTSDTTYGKGSL